MFLKKPRFSFTLAAQTTFINLLGFLIAFGFIFFTIYLKYLNEEEIKVNQKLLKYWTLTSHLSGNEKTEAQEILSIARSEYQRDTDAYRYALRIEGKDSDLFLYPSVWKNEDIRNADFLRDFSSNNGNVLEVIENGRIYKTQFMLYEIEQSDYTIQIIVSSKERSLFFSRILQSFIGILVIFIIISYVVSRVIVARSLRPLQRINELAEQIILEQNIDKRIPIDLGGEFTRIQLNLNKMLDVIERQVTSLRSSAISLGHDIRIPLTRVLNYLEDSLTKKRSQKEHRKILLSIQSVKSIQNIARQVLDLSEIEAGTQKIPRNKIQLSQALESIVDMYSLIAEEKGVLFNSVMDPQCCMRIEEVRIRQLVGNLLDNAVKSTVEGQMVSLHIYKKKETIVIVVKDTGIGIEQKNISNIWKSTWKKQYTQHDLHAHGGGFGLSIVKGIVAAYNGTIDVDSTLGKGTVFTVHFSFV